MLNVLQLAFLLSSCLRACALPVGRNAAAVLSSDFPDPAFLQVDNTFYAFATAGNGHKIQVASSPSFTQPAWQLLSTDILPDAGDWTDGSSNIWAPYVFRADNDRYVLYYSAPPSSDSSKHCIGTATSQSVTGPYTPSTSSWVCPLNEGGAIDPAVFRDPQSGNVYVAYKVDGNSISDSTPTPIRSQQVSTTDGVSTIGDPVTILQKDESDGPLVEAPGLFFAGGKYYLLFSTHLYNTDDYDTRYASSTTITGPYAQVDSPILKTGDAGLTSPGSAAVDARGGNLLFHATVSRNPDGGPVRYLFAGSINVNQDGSVVASVMQ